MSHDENRGDCRHGGEAVAKMGRVDTVIANAGVGGGAKSFSEFSTETYRRVLAVNLDGVFFTFREACKHMIARAAEGDTGGSLVAISSLSAIDGAARNEAYASTKGAVISMIRAIAVEHARYGVRANAILPGWIATDMTAGAQGNDQVQRSGDQARAVPPLGRAPGFRRHGSLPGVGCVQLSHRRAASQSTAATDLLIDRPGARETREAVAVGLTGGPTHRRCIALPARQRGEQSRNRPLTLHTKLCDLLRVEHPIMLAGMGGVSYARRAGGRRLERGRLWRSGDGRPLARLHPRRDAQDQDPLTDMPFGVDLLAASPGRP